MQRVGELEIRNQVSKTVNKMGLLTYSSYSFLQVFTRELK
jgi:hypothetical protein